MDLAREHADFQGFERGAREFFESTHQDIVAEWDEALQAQRAGAPDLPDLAKVKAEQWQPHLVVALVHAPSSSQISDVPSMAA